MAYNPKGVAEAKNKVGVRRQAIEKALQLAVVAWLDGKPGDLCMGDLYQEFFKGHASEGKS